MWILIILIRDLQSPSSESASLIKDPNNTGYIFAENNEDKDRPISRILVWLFAPVVAEMLKYGN